MANFVFNNEDAVVASAQQIVASRIQFKVETGKPFKLNVDQHQAIEDLKTYLALNMASNELEHQQALYFEGGGRLIKSVNVGVGTNSQVAVNHKEIVRQGLLCNADLVVMAHNHPNQDAVPSDNDTKAMKSLAKTLSTFDMQLIMSFVVAGPTPDKVVPIPEPEPDSGDMLRRLFGDRMIELIGNGN
jgi:DNA repair protein RadC